MRNSIEERHGHWHSPTYRSWDKMRARCNNPGETSFYLYGGRGIRVCERWMDFRNFLADMGERPPGRTLDRIDSNRDYEPGNCRWATPSEQAANRKALNLTLLSPLMLWARGVANADRQRRKTAARIRKKFNQLKSA